MLRIQRRKFIHFQMLWQMCEHEDQTMMGVEPIPAAATAQMARICESKMLGAMLQRLDSGKVNGLVKNPNHVMLLSASWETGCAVSHKTAVSDIFGILAVQM